MTLKQIVVSTLKNINSAITIPELVNLIWEQSNHGKSLGMYNALIKTFEQGHVNSPKAELQNRIYAQNKNWKEIFVDKTVSPHQILLHQTPTLPQKSSLIKDEKIFHLSFEIYASNINSFMNHWEKKYLYQAEYKYDKNIGKPLTENSRLELFEWKNGSIISRAKLKSIEENYPLIFTGNREEQCK